MKVEHFKIRLQRLLAKIVRQESIRIKLDKQVIVLRAQQEDILPLDLVYVRHALVENTKTKQAKAAVRIVHQVIHPNLIVIQ